MTYGAEKLGAIRAFLLLIARGPAPKWLEAKGILADWLEDQGDGERADKVRTVARDDNVIVQAVLDVAVNRNRGEIAWITEHALVVCDRDMRRRVLGLFPGVTVRLEASISTIDLDMHDRDRSRYVSDFLIDKGFVPHIEWDTRVDKEQLCVWFWQTIPAPDLVPPEPVRRNLTNVTNHLIGGLTAVIDDNGLRYESPEGARDPRELLVSQGYSAEAIAQWERSESGRELIDNYRRYRELVRIRNHYDVRLTRSQVREMVGLGLPEDPDESEVLQPSLPDGLSARLSQLAARGVPLSRREIQRQMANLGYSDAVLSRWEASGPQYEIVDTDDLIAWLGVAESRWLEGAGGRTMTDSMAEYQRAIGRIGRLAICPGCGHDGHAGACH